MTATVRGLVAAALGLRAFARDRRARQWVAAGNDRTKRLDYDLGPDSMVFDLGGYQGQWSGDIVDRYHCHIHVFEPVTSMAENIANRFAGNRHVQVHDFGLGRDNTTVKIWLDADASSIVHAPSHGGTAPAGQEVRIVRFNDFVREHGITSIDLVKINIEGGEYDLLEHIIETEIVGILGNIQVQFHDFVPGARRRMKAIQSRLSTTHELTYQSEFVWENWRRR